MRRFLLIAACVLVPGLSLAAQAPQPKTTTLVIDGDDVITSDPMRPNGDTVVSRENAKFRSVIHVRKDFGDKVKASVSEL